MRFATMEHRGRVAFGPVEGGELRDLSAAYGSLADAVAAHTAHDGALDATVSDAPPIAVAEARFLPPIPAPERILCIGVNYHAHRAESDRAIDTPYPTVFVRFPSSLVGHRQPILRPRVSNSFDWEGELAVIIGRRGRYIDRDAALAHVAGYACFMDGTLRDYQRHSTQFIPGKTFDSSGAFGPEVVTADEVGDATNLTLRTTVNGQEMQCASTADLIHDVPALIAYCSEFTTLQPGDVIATGTPGGVGYARTPPIFLAPGDVVEVSIDRVGTLRNVVEDEPRWDPFTITGRPRASAER